MHFHSYQFLIFLTAVVCGHHLLPPRLRWLWLLIASYVFYGAWRVEYLGLILASTAVDYTAGRLLANVQQQSLRRLLLAASLTLNLGLLFTFKYFNFMADSAAALLSAAGMHYVIPHLGVLLPVGISFYTFQTLSYTIDVYRREILPEPHLGRFALFVAFFPQLVAGPIERAGRLLPQLTLTHAFDYTRVRAGLMLMLYGFFKKVVIADRLGIVVDFVFDNPQRCPGPVLLFGALCFAFQIYCDFSGYTDIARGCARLFGIELMKNFDRPYFALSIADFWRRWHISLTTWFRDYVYIPLGGNRSRRTRWLINVTIVFLVSGLWHGANWTFVAWGLVHALAYLIERAAGLNRHDRSETMVRRLPRIAATFLVVTLAWVFFRATTMSDAFYILAHIPQQWSTLLGTAALTDLVHSMDVSWRWMALSTMLVATLLAIETWLGNREWDAALAARPTWQRWIVYITLAFAILNLGPLNETPFVYYQF